MRQFYEIYCHDEIISPLVRQLPWTHNLIILTQLPDKKLLQEKPHEFYLQNDLSRLQDEGQKI